MDIYVVNLADQLENEFSLEPWLQFLSAERRKTVCQYRKWEDRLRSFTGDCLIRNLAGAYLGCRPSEVRIVKDSNGGKPVLPDGGIHYNISHSGEWVVCAIDNSPIGIDVEEKRPINFEIAERFFTVDEYAALMTEPPEQQLAVFYDLWTLKESYLKLSGLGLSKPLNSFNIKKNGKDYYEENGTCCFRQYEVDPDYRLSVCAEHANFPQEVIRFPLDQMLREFC